MESADWCMDSGNEGLGFVARGKVAICGFMFGKEQSDADFLLKVQWAIDDQDLCDIVEFQVTGKPDGDERHRIKFADYGVEPIKLEPG